MDNLDKNGKNKLFLALIGGLSGFLNGFFGGGGGMLVVPLLKKLTKLTDKQAHATAILIILPLSLLSGVLYSVYGNADLNLLWQVGIGTTLGGILGAFALCKLKNRYIEIIFSVVMAVAGVFSLFC